MVADPFHEGLTELGHKVLAKLPQKFSVGGEISVDEIIVGEEILATMVAVTVASMEDEGAMKREGWGMEMDEAARAAPIVGNRATGSKAFFI